MQFKRAKLRWRTSHGARRSLGWVPFKASAVAYKNGQLWMGKTPLSLWDSYGLAGYDLGAGSVSQDARGRWYINLTVKVKKTVGTRDMSLITASAIGIDLGLEDLMVDSNGTKVKAQQFYRDMEAKLAIAQRTGHKARTRAIYAKVANRRKDFAHKLSTAQVKTHRAIFVGAVNAQALSQTNMAKSVLDAGWSQYRTMLKYKCDDAGAWFGHINEIYSTQECSACGARTGPKGLPGLKVRTWTCSGCHKQHDRDTNSANVIKARGLIWLEQEFVRLDVLSIATEAKARQVALHKAAWTWVITHLTQPGPGMALC